MNYTIGPTIGRGSTATVSLATTATGDVFAVKSTTSSILQEEQYVLSKVRSPHVIKYIGFDISGDGDNNNIPMYNMLMEYAPGGTISDVIKRQGGSLEECMIRSYTHQILLGLDYLHSNHILHSDIKPANILVFNESSVKIGDLGCAKFVANNNNIINGEVTSSIFSGTPVYMAPEVARGEAQGFAADVWALGCTVIEMATGSHPWQGLNNPVSALYRIGYSGDVPLIPGWLSDEAKDFLKKCLERNEKERWRVKELLQHPFVNSGFRSEKIENFLKCSPSSILSQGFWDSFEEHEVSPEPTQFVGVSGECRIKQLVEAAPVNCCLSNWVGEGDWITVRGDYVEENLSVIHEDLFIDLDMEGEISESTRSDSESISELYVEEEFHVLVRSIIESNVLETSDASVVNSRFLDFKNINNKSCLLIDLILTLQFVHDSVKPFWLKLLVKSLTSVLKIENDNTWRLDILDLLDWLFCRFETFFILKTFKII